LPSITPDEVAELRRRLDQFDARWHQALAALLPGRRWSDGRHLSAVSWLAERTGLARGEAAGCVELANAIGRMPTVLDAWRNGSLNRSKVRVLQRGRTASPTTERRFDDDAALLTGLAASLPVEPLRRAVEHWIMHADPDGDVARSAATFERRYLHVSTLLDGMVKIDGLLDPESGAIFRQALAEAMPPPSPAEPRDKPSQRRADALVAMSSFVCGHRNPDRAAKPREAVAVINIDWEPEPASCNECDQCDPHGTSAPPHDTGAAPQATGKETHHTSAPPQDTSEPSHDTGASSHTCAPSQATGAPSHDAKPSRESDQSVAKHHRLRGDLDGHPLDQDTIHRLLCDALLTRVLMKPPSEPLDVGRATRTIHAGLRRAVQVRDGGCRFPGCDRPFSWCDVHHIRHWAQGGLTALGNLAALCRRHHRLGHQPGYEFELRGSTLYVTTPSGQRFATEPRRYDMRTPP
jgi:hypothetical protein